MAEVGFILFAWLMISPVLASDWLVDEITTPTTLTKTQDGTLLLSNGLVSREFTTAPDFATVDYFSHERQSSLLRAVGPEAVVRLDGVEYSVGGLLTSVHRAYLNRTALALNMTQNSSAFHFASYQTTKPFAPYKYVPRRGAPSSTVWPPRGLRLDVTFSAPSSAPTSHQSVKIKVHYEMYDGIPLMTKWVTISNPTMKDDEVEVEVLSVEKLAVNWQWSPQGYNWFFLQTDQAHGTNVSWYIDPDQKHMAGSFEPMVDCVYTLIPRVPIGKGFESFRVLELVTATEDRERTGLAKHRMMRLLAPQTQESPIYFHTTKSESAGFRALVDQLAEVGFEMIVYSFGSGIHPESDNASYIAKEASDIAYANSKGLEVGAYDLIAWTRHSKPEWTAKTHDQHKGSCFASRWYDYLLDHIVNFIQKTNLTAVVTDGPYAGYTCESTNHSHHIGLQDSVYQQTRLQGEFYTNLHNMGIYLNQPDDYFYQGANKRKYLYNEHTYSLPRWEDLSIARQLVYDDSYKWGPTVGWMFLPMSVYHGGGSAATFGPASKHKAEFNFALAQYLGLGISTVYRGTQLYDDDESKQIVLKWVTFFKKYRDILTSDLIHVRYPDMQGIDCLMHVNPYIENKGLAMVYNPTQRPASVNLILPLYYTGITGMASVYQEGVHLKQYTLDRQYKIVVPVSLSPYSVTWYLIK